jgi:A/G-specific adenine glycosylase
LHKTAQIVAYELNGTFPNNYKALLKLKGVGDYTAAAIASFSFNEKVPVVDGNVFRVLSRYFGIESDISIASTKKEFQDLAFELMPNDAIATFNQAIMEFGALQCVPKNPNCSVCVMNHSCVALQKKMVNQLPVKSKKIKVTQRYFNYLILEDENEKTIINQRTDKGIWHNLYEFPLIETLADVDDKIIATLIKEHILFENKINNIFSLNEKSQLHILTHQRLHIKFWKIEINGVLQNGIDIEKLKTYPFPIVLFNFIENHFRN